MLKRFSSNAAANVFSGAVAAAYQMVITAIAVATWHGSDFAAWGLAMSIAAIAPIFSLSLSSVVTRRLVETRYSGSEKVGVAIVLAGRRISWGLASMAFVILLCTGAWIQGHSVSGPLTMSEFLICLVMLVSTNSWVLLWQVRFGQYYADERNWLPAYTLACARAGGILGMLVALAIGSQSLIAIAVGLFAGTWIALFVSELLLPSPQRTGGEGERPTTLEIRVQCQRNLQVLYGFAFGAASSLIIQYSIPPLIALIAPQRFGAFYLAGTFNAVALGVLSASMSALLAPFTRWHTTGSVRAMQRIALFSPILCVGVCLSILCVCWFTLELILDSLTTHSTDINDVRLFLALLGLQAIVRTSAAGYATYVSSAGTSRQMGTPLVVEMVLAFTVAVPLGWLFGVNALMLGLTLAGFIGSQFSSKAFTSLSVTAQIPARTAFASLLTAQLVGSALWWWIVGNIL